jgi:hypothetical protein
MSRFYTSAATVTMLTLLPLCLSTDQLFAAANEPDKTAPQGTNPPGADDTSQTNQPLVPRKGVITPPPTGDEGIHIQAPNPNAGHDEEVIPPPGTPGGGPSVEPR